MTSWRQKVLLALLERVPGRRVSRIQLVKWLFLLKEEEDVGRYGSFYDFLPYKFGPFSFLAYRDLTEFERLGWVAPDQTSFEYIGPDEQVVHSDLAVGVTNCIERVLHRYGSLSAERLLAYVYQRYPWYASKSEISKRPCAEKAELPDPGIYSIGYQGLSIDALLNVIMKTGLPNVIDVRNNPGSRKYGFSRLTLEARCKDVGILYHHFPQVGIPSSIRRCHRESSRLWSVYENTILPTAARTVESIGFICLRNPSALLCFERNPSDCHRSLLAREISDRTGLPVVHYMAESRAWVKESGS